LTLSHKLPWISAYLSTYQFTPFIGIPGFFLTFTNEELEITCGGGICDGIGGAPV